MLAAHLFYLWVSPSVDGVFSFCSVFIDSILLPYEVRREPCHWYTFSCLRHVHAIWRGKEEGVPACLRAAAAAGAGSKSEERRVL